MTHTFIPSPPGGETDAARGCDAVGRVPHEGVLGGEWTPSAGGAVEVGNPATEDVIAPVADASRPTGTTDERSVEHFAAGRTGRDR